MEIKFIEWVGEGGKGEVGTLVAIGFSGRIWYTKVPRVVTIMLEVVAGDCFAGQGTK